MVRYLLLTASLLLACSSDTSDPVSPSNAGGTDAQGGAGTAGSGGQAPAGTAGAAGTGDPILCTPGQSIACTGPAGCQGGQVCNKDRLGFGPCDCGAAGAGGVAGNGGSGGGSAGDGGSAGEASGAAGSAGEGGAAGGGGACEPRACEPSECGAPDDGCGSPLECLSCPGWQACGVVAPDTYATCSGVCEEAPLPPEATETCEQHSGKGKPVAVKCAYKIGDPVPVDADRCDLFISVPGFSHYCCKTP